jgi:hypothetical protein
VAIAIALAGCGGGGGESNTTTGASVGTSPTTSSQARPTSTTSTTSTEGTQTVKEVNHAASPGAAVKLLLLSSNPQTGCSNDLVTSHYLQEAYGGLGGCVKAVSPNSAAKSLGTVLVDVSDDKATATVHPVGGLYDGEKITVSLVKEDGTWKVDSLKSNAPVGP